MELKSQLRIAVIACLAALAAVLGAGAEPSADRGDAWLAGEFEGSREEVLELMAHYEAIQLTPEQEAVRREALGPVPAFCCKNFSAATCCCECNLSRTLWGLSKVLITQKNADAGQVRDAVRALVEVLNPSGYRGDTCTTGRCNTPFKKGGCGGMNKDRLLL